MANAFSLDQLVKVIEAICSYVVGTVLQIPCINSGLWVFPALCDTRSRDLDYLTIPPDTMFVYYFGNIILIDPGITCVGIFLD